MTTEDIAPLATGRLVLRLVDASDEAAIHRHRSHPAATRYLSHDPLSVYEPNTPSIRLLQSLGFHRDPGLPSENDSAGKGLPLLMFRLNAPQPSSGLP